MKFRLLGILLVLTLAFGTAGYAMAGQTVYEALAQSFLLLVLNALPDPTNMLIEIGRWLGFLFGMNVVYVVVESAFAAAFEELRLRWRCKKDDTIAIHGDDTDAEMLAKAMGKRAVVSDRPASFTAPKQAIIFDTDAETLAFFAEHEKELLAAEELFICLEGISPISFERSNVHIFSLDDIRSQLYWEEFPATEPERIALVGNGSSAWRMLYQGLLVNIFNLDSGIDYHVYGDLGEYRGAHPFLEKAVAAGCDTIVFHDSLWEGGIEELREFDRIILCDASADNIAVASALRGAGVMAPIHLQADTRNSASLLGSNGITVFGTQEEVCTEAIIIQEILLDAGKRYDITYSVGTDACNGCTALANFPADGVDWEMPYEAREAVFLKRMEVLNYDVCLRCPKFKAHWDELDAFTRCSNYAVAAHDGQKRRLLEAAFAAEGVNDYDALSLEKRDELQEIEHIRWVRFHYLNNWSFAEGGKDKIARTHHYLRPYSELSRPVKDMDNHSYRTLLLRDKQ